MMQQKLGLLALVTLFLAACAAPPRAPEPTPPPPSKPPESTVKIDRDTGTRIMTVPRPSVSEPKPPKAHGRNADTVAMIPKQSQPAYSNNRAVDKLLERAAIEEDRDNLKAAENLLERAQRIAPRDSEVFFQLARVKQAQKSYVSAEQFALKASELAGGSGTKQKRIWSLLAEIRMDSGDLVGAQRAKLKARRY